MKLSRNYSSLRESLTTPIIYPTIQSEQLFNQRSEFLQMYQEYIHAKELHQQQSTNHASTQSRPNTNLNIVQLHMNSQQDVAKKKPYNVRTQMKKYKNMTLFDKIKHLDVSNNRTVVQTQPDSSSQIFISRSQSQCSNNQQQPKRKQSLQRILNPTRNTINTYQRILLQIAKSEAAERDAMKEYSTNIQPTIKQQQQPLTTKKITRPVTPVKTQVSPITMTKKQQKPIRILHQQHIEINKPTFRGWDTTAVSNRSFSL